MKLNKAKLLGGSTLEFGSFNVFIGGNGVGKTTVLIELFHKIAGIQRTKYFWVDSTEHSVENCAADLQALRGSFTKKYEGASLFYHSNAIKDLNGNIDNNNDFRLSGEEFRRLESATDPSILNEIKYRRPFISLLSCDSRLNLDNEAGLASFDGPPSDSINLLYRNKRLLQDIDSTLFNRFNYHLAILDHTGSKLHIGVSPEAPPTFNRTTEDLQVEYARIEEWRERHFTPIKEAGHGMRSMIKLLLSLFDPVNQVILIDEPEMHLYPSQKRWLGKELVRLANTQSKQVFLVTHDPMILQGILDCNGSTKVFRVSRDTEGVGAISSCELQKGEDATANRNQEQYLQGLFYQRCIAVEGASDRSFYQNLFDDYSYTTDKDLGFVVMGGKGSLKNFAHIVSKVGLTAAFVCDLDVLFHEMSVLKDLYTILGGEESDPLKDLVTALTGSFATVMAESDKDKRWTQLKAAIVYSDKQGLGSEWLEENKAVYNSTIEKLAAVGIFFVPNGTLESWAPDVEPKVRFAELAPDVIRADAALKGKLNAFAKSVSSYIGMVE